MNLGGDFVPFFKKVTCKTEVPTTELYHSLQLVSMNKRSAMLLDRLMYNLKEIMKKQPGKDDSGSKESSVITDEVFSKVNENESSSPHKKV